MRNFTESNVELLNRQGKLLRKLILQLSDEELMNFTPTPSSNMIKRLKLRMLRLSRMLMTKN
jgi:hypothetical protein